MSRRTDQLAPAVLVGAAGIAVVLLFHGCSVIGAFRELGSPPQPKTTAPRPCVGVFAYPDSVGHCVPRDTSTGVP